MRLWLTTPQHPRATTSLCVFLALIGCSAPLRAADAPVSFSRDIAPILQKKCQTCHNEDKSKGDYRLDTFEALLKPGSSKEKPILAGQPDTSEFFRLLIEKDPDDRMPQKDDPLPAAQIALIKRWITEGAKFDGPNPKAQIATLIPKTAHPQPPALYTFPAPVTALAFRPDGAELAVSGYHEVLIWQPESGTLLRRIQNLPRHIRGLAYSPDGKRLAVAGGAPGESGELALVDLASKDAVQTLGTMREIMLAVVFTPDGQRVITGGADNSIHIFNTSSGVKERTIQQHADWVVALAVNPEGTFLASASRDRTARTFNLKTGEMEDNYTGHDAAVYAVAFSSDGKTIYSAGRDKTIDTWAAKDGKKGADIKGFNNDILQLLVVSNSLYSASADKLVRQHNVADRNLVRTLPEHADWVYALAANAPTRRLATGSYNGDIRLFNLDDGKPLTNFLAAPGLVKGK